MLKKLAKACMVTGALLLSGACAQAAPSEPTAKVAEKSLAQLTAAANKSDVLSQLTLARKYSQGEGVKQDHVEAVKWMRKAAAAADPKAQTMLGAAYTRGLGVTRDDTVAHNWYLLASMQDYSDANYMLGMRYVKGTEGTPRNVARGLALLNRAVDQGVPDALVNLGIFYLKGENVDKDVEKAVGYITAAAQVGNASAFALLGVLYEHGLGVPQSNKKAWGWTTMSLHTKPDSAQELATIKDLEAKMSVAEQLAAVQWAYKCAESQFKDCD